MSNALNCAKAKSLWVYSSATDTATKYTLPELPAGMGPGGGAAGGEGSTSTSLGAGVDLPAKIQQAIDEFAPSASVVFDASIENYLDAEAATVLAELATKRMIEAARSGPSKGVPR